VEPCQASPQAIAGQGAVDLLNRDTNSALADPVLKQGLAEFGAVPIAGNACQFRAMLAVETERGRKVVEISGQKERAGRRTVFRWPAR
jgi:hypothetical protein